MSLPAVSPKLEELPVEFSDEHDGLAILGFWIFLASDVVLFSCLFAVYAVYQARFGSGPTPAQLSHFGPAFTATLLLLTSSFTCGLAIYQLRRHNVTGLVAWLTATIALGLAFVTLEIQEFAADAAAGATWNRSAFLSAFFTLVGAHGVHVSFGIIWAVVLVIQILRQGLSAANARKVYTFSLYWHFLDIIWIFIFTVVYLNAKIA